MRIKPAGLIIAIGLGCALPNALPGQDSAALSSVRQHKNIAEQALHAGDLSAAEREFRTIIALDPNDSEALTGLGVLLYGQGKIEEAVATLRKSLQVDPAAKRAELFLALSQADLGNCAEAKPVLAKSFASEQAGKLHRLTGLALLGCESRESDSLPALEVAARLKQQYPDDADVLYECAELYTHLWNESAGELLAKHPDSYRVHQLAAEVYEAQNNYAQAIREYSLALAANWRVPQLHFRIGQLYLREGAPDADEKAMKEFRLEKTVDPQSAVADLAMAEIYRHQQKLDEAKALYQEAARIDPSLAEAQVGLAQTLIAQHQPAAAITVLQTVSTKYPQDPSAHYALMLAYREQGKMPEAAAEMAKFKQLQTAKDQNFQNKLDALLSAKAPSGGSASK